MEVQKIGLMGTSGAGKMAMMLQAMMAPPIAIGQHFASLTHHSARRPKQGKPGSRVLRGYYSRFTHGYAEYFRSRPPQSATKRKAERKRIDQQLKAKRRAYTMGRQWGARVIANSTIPSLSRAIRINAASA